MGQGTAQILVYAAVLIALSYPLGIWMARVYTREQGDVIERGFLRLLGRDAATDQNWKQYGRSVIVFTIAFSVFLYGLLRLQGHLFLNPDHLPAVPWTVALNTTASFVTNTNWQYYAGEATMSYLSQMAGLAVQQFVSAGVGLAVVAAVIRGIARRGGGVGLGNFWRDLYRSIVYILLPLSIVLAVVLISQGVPQTFHGHVTATTLQGAHQTIARGPVASMISIKQLGTNGGGYYDSNSAVPFENPTPLSNFLEVLAILLIPFAQVVMFGRMVLARRHAWVLYAVCFSIFAIGVSIAFPAEQHGSAVLRNSGVNITNSASQSGGNMTDKEIRFGIANTALWATATTDVSNGSVNGGHDALHARGRSCAARGHVPRRGRAGRRGLRPVRPDLLHPDCRLRCGSDGRTDAGMAREEDRGARDETRGRRCAVRPDDGARHDGCRHRDAGRAGVHLQPGRARLQRDALRVHVPVEQQRQRVRRLRRDDVLDDVRDSRALLRPLLPDARRARDRRLARGEEGRSRFGRDVPH